jgi:C4-type Zn-finger protein
MEEKKEKECPWCQGSLILEESHYRGPHGKMKILRCGKCFKLISARLEGEPDRIIKRELIEGGSL